MSTDWWHLRNNKNWYGCLFLLIMIWYLGLKSLEWRFPVYLGGFSMFTYTASFILLRNFSKFWANLTPSQGAQLSGICENTKTVSVIGFLVADIATLATLVNDS